ncbi:ribosome maturation factor RimM [Luteimonas sp. gir]|uniref:ribosome maturation factor RimM n=1 Tax=Luteimonas sp. gir TaxID=3127960 RepID=UPI003075DC93
MNDPTRQPPQRMIQLGKVHGAFGVRGEVKLESFTEPRSAIFRYQPWVLRDGRGGERTLSGARGRETPKGVVATLPDIADRDAAEAARGLEVWVPREALPPPAPGEYYWVDLEGLRVRNLDGVDLGTVSHLFSTGANDVLVAQSERERMIPFVVPDYVVSIDFDAGLVTVDWDADF